MYLSEIPVASNDATPSWVTGIVDVGKGLLAIKQQSDLQKINTQRLAQGLDPLDASAVATQVSVGMPPAQLNKILWAGGAVVALLALLIVMRKR